VIIIVQIITKGEFIWKDSMEKKFVELVECCIICFFNNSQKYQFQMQ